MGIRQRDGETRAGPARLFRYVDERLFAYNQRGLSDLGRFSAVLAHLRGVDSEGLRVGLLAGVNRRLRHLN